EAVAVEQRDRRARVQRDCVAGVDEGIDARKRSLLERRGEVLGGRLAAAGGLVAAFAEQVANSGLDLVRCGERSDGPRLGEPRDGRGCRELGERRGAADHEATNLEERVR